MIKNAIIEAASLTMEERDILTVWLTLDYGGTGQGFGGYALSLGKDYVHRNDEKESVFCGLFIRRCMEVAGVTDWSRMKGRPIRVKTDSDNKFGGKIVGIGHIVDDDWFFPEEWTGRVFDHNRDSAA